MTICCGRLRRRPRANCTTSQRHVAPCSRLGRRRLAGAAMRRLRQAPRASLAVSFVHGACARTHESTKARRARARARAPRASYSLRCTQRLESSLRCAGCAGGGQPLATSRCTADHSGYARTPRTRACAHACTHAIVCARAHSAPTRSAPTQSACAQVAPAHLRLVLAPSRPRVDHAHTDPCVHRSCSHWCGLHQTPPAAAAELQHERACVLARCVRACVPAYDSSTRLQTAPCSKPSLGGVHSTCLGARQARPERLSCSCSQLPSHARLSRASNAPWRLLPYRHPQETR